MNWDDIQDLERRVLMDGESLVLTDELRDILRLRAAEVALPAPATEQSLQAEATARVLLEEIARRIREGSVRLGRATSQAYKHQQAGDNEAARRVLEAILDVEVVPHYRDVAQIQLEALDEE
ncbi:DUSAM domain-containing protein [Myxococcus sp. K38C18041901]|uniref:DUSAM domain-containing protein n=1 Tax=Myxococcus guangdongensis TaxID=2906760 RepID=UPI0020A7E66E|nr:DUSAM domain-containing protein [Myxococcus guangdongensis]MCP3065755.1 DUSAM domain-containing protein [Myxococcus guangdongensis]